MVVHRGELRPPGKPLARPFDVQRVAQHHGDVPEQRPQRRPDPENVNPQHIALLQARKEREKKQPTLTLIKRAGAGGTVLICPSCILCRTGTCSSLTYDVMFENSTMLIGEQRRVVMIVCSASARH